MNFLSFISAIFKPAVDIVDELNTSEEEKLRIKSEIFSAQSEVTLRVIEYEKSLVDARASVVKSEANGQSWLQRNWRPIMMLVFLFLVVCDSFGLLAFRLADQAWVLLQLGVGGYVAGRSLEKVAPRVTELFKKS